MSAATAKRRGVLSTPPGLFNEPLAGRQVRLSDPEFAPQLEALKQRLRDDPDFGKSLLRKAGIINNKGKLTKAYGG
jgi:hypothetical protein